MIIIKDRSSIRKMEEAGCLLADIFKKIIPLIRPGANTLELDSWIESELKKRGLVSQSKGYNGYKHVSCISMNDEVVHGIPTSTKILKSGDLIKIDVCASLDGFCADMARSFLVGEVVCPKVRKLATIAQSALDKGTAKARAGNHLSDISAAIQQEVEKHGFGVIRDFAGHGIGKKMHEEPEILNYGEPGQGPVLKPGMTFALEPMITMGRYDVYVADDGWTVKTVDKSYAAHVENTIAITKGEPKILTKDTCEQR